MIRLLKKLKVNLFYYLGVLLVRTGRAMGAQAVFKRASISAKVIRHDGRVEDLGVISNAVSNI